MTRSAAAPAKGKQAKVAGDLPRTAEEIDRLCTSLPGWTVNRGNHGFRVSNGVTQTTVAYRLQDGRALPNTHRALIRMGILTAWQAKVDADEKERLRNIALDRRRNEKLLAAAEERAAAPPLPPVVSVKDLFVPPTTKAPAKTPTVPEQRTVVEWIDKDRAAELLNRPLPHLPDGRALKQRPLNNAWVSDLIQAMRDGDWQVTHQGIALAPEPPHNTGGLFDGQHRLTAVFMGDLKVQMNVTYNADPRSFVALDVGRTRTTAHVLTIGDHKNATLLASALKLMIAWEEWVKDPKGPMADWTVWNRVRSTPSQLQHVLERYPDIEEDVAHAGLYTSRPLNISGAAIAVFRYVTRHRAPGAFTGDDDNPGALDLFLYKIRTGLGVSKENKNDPAWRLRNWFLTGAHRRVLIGEDPNRRAAPGREVSLLKLITSWNKDVMGEEVRQVKVQEREAMVLPRIPRNAGRR